MLRYHVQIDCHGKGFITTGAFMHIGDAIHYHDRENGGGYPVRLLDNKSGQVYTENELKELTDKFIDDRFEEDARAAAA